MMMDYEDVVRNIRDGMQGFNNTRNIFIYRTIFEGLDPYSVDEITVGSAAYVPFLHGAIEHNKMTVGLAIVGDDGARLKREYVEGVLTKESGDAIALARTMKKNVRVEVRMGDETKIYSIRNDADEHCAQPMEFNIVAEWAIRGRYKWHAYHDGSMSSPGDFAMRGHCYRYDDQSGVGVEYYTDGTYRIMTGRKR